MWEAALKRRSKLTRLAPAAVAGSLTTTFTLVTPHEDSEPNLERFAGLSKTPYQMRLAPCQAARPYLPNVLALQVKISGGIKICQALLNALVVPNNHAQGTIKFVQCTPNACLRCHDCGVPTASGELGITQADLLTVRSIIESVLVEMRHA